MKKSVLISVLAMSAGLVSACGAASSSGQKSASVETCSGLIKDVVDTSQKSDSGGGKKIVQIYKPKTVKDDQGKYGAGTLKVPAGKTDVTVLTCEGTAAWDNTESSKVRYTLAYDLNKDPWVAYEEVS